MLQKYLEKVWEFEEKGCIDDAVELCGKLAEAFPREADLVLTEKAKLEFRNGRDREALLGFVGVYTQTQNTELYELILEAYLWPNQKELQRRYQNNLQMMKGYSFYYNDYEEEELDIYALWVDEELLCMVDTVQRTFGVVLRLDRHESERKETTCMLVNLLWLEDVLYYKNQTKTEHPLLDRENAFYLVYDRNQWMLLAQLIGLEELCEGKRAVFLIGETSFCRFFEDPMAVSPSFSRDGGMNGRYEELLEGIIRQKKEELALYKKENARYYKRNNENVIQNIRNGKSRILFWTSRFTTALQYHTRDCMQAAQRMGCETRLLIEPDGVRRAMDLAYEKCMREFRPDIVFVIDHFRNDIPIPKEVVFITWVQDSLPHIMDHDAPSRLGERDFVMNHYTTWKVFQNIGYPKRALIDAPIPANSYIYKPYTLSEKEWKNYMCDICFVCHASDVEGHIEDVIARFTNAEEIRDLISSIYRGYQSYVYETGVLFYEEKKFEEFIYGAITQCYQFTPPEDLVEILANDMYQWFNQRVFRQALVDWILDAGFTNIKLWGNGWQNIPKYKKYAMGPAQNGETLSKIYQAAKIVIGNNVQTTAAARAWETMLSGGFYMSNYIPPESDAVDIRKIVKADEEVVMFYGKEDLIQKVTYYLEYEEERQRMIEIGRKVALERMTFDKLMEKVLNEVANRLGERNS